MFILKGPSTDLLELCTFFISHALSLLEKRTLPHQSPHPSSLVHPTFLDLVTPLNASSVRNSVVNEKSMRPGHWSRLVLSDRWLDSKKDISL